MALAWLASLVNEKITGTETVDHFMVYIINLGSNFTYLQMVRDMMDFQFLLYISFKL